MPNNLVLVTHAGFAEGILSSLKLIMGDPCRTAAVSVTATETVPTVAHMIEEAIDSLDAENPTVVLTDIPGGSTTQAALLVRQSRPDVVFAAGLNLGMLLEIALLPLTREDAEGNAALVREAIAASKEGIGLLDDLVPRDGDSPDADSGEL